MSIEVSLLLNAKENFLSTLHTQTAPADTVAMGQAGLANMIVQALLADGEEKSEFNTTAIKTLLEEVALALDVDPE